jgi:hypothetical protein
MKIQYIFFMMLMVVMTDRIAFAQEAEYDDMYFNSKDRQKIMASRVDIQTTARKNDKSQPDEEVNPTDSYSARNVNPEYTSRSNSQVAQADNEDYFDNSYQLQRQAQLSQWNRNYNNWYNDPWYSSAYFGSGINRWNSPYYGSYYDRFNNPWQDPYYRSAWSSSFSYSYGNNWNYGWGMNSGYGCPNNYWNNSWYSPSYSAWYSPFNSSYSPYGYNGYGGGYGGYYGYPTTVVVVENGHQPVYGKRGSRGTTNISSNTSYSRPYSNSGSGSRSEGRVSRSTGTQQQYYENSWQNQSRDNTSSSNGRVSTTSTSQQNSGSSWRQSSGSNNSSYTPSRSTQSSSGGNTRSSGSSNNSSGSRSSSSSRGRGGH